MSLDQIEAKILQDFVEEAAAVARRTPTATLTEITQLLHGRPALVPGSHALRRIVAREIALREAGQGSDVLLDEQPADLTDRQQELHNG